MVNTMAPTERSVKTSCKRREDEDDDEGVMSYFKFGRGCKKRKKKKKTFLKKISYRERAGWFRCSNGQSHCQTQCEHHWAPQIPISECSRLLGAVFEWKDDHHKISIDSDDVTFDGFQDGFIQSVGDVCAWEIGSRGWEIGPAAVSTTTAAAYRNRGLSREELQERASFFMFSGVCIAGD